MGGSIALTIRFASGDEYRGSCWTNVLPEGLWAAPVYLNTESSKAHTRTWLSNLLKHRQEDPDLEEIWGGHNLLAPLQYGLILIDYVTDTLISANGYSSPDWMIDWKRDYDPGETEKWNTLSAAGLLKFPGPWPDGEFSKPNAYITMPFKNVICVDANEINEAMMQWCDENFGLSAEEKEEWRSFIAHWDE